MKKGILLFFIQAMVTFIAAFNMRAIAQANYTWTIISEVLVGIMIYLSVKEIADKAHPTAKLIGYVCGGVVGSVIGIYISKIVLLE
jgi:hypothetical protein